MRITVQSVAALKRAIATPNIQIRVVDHWQPRLRDTTRQPKAIRASGKSGIQTNGYWFDGPNHEGKIVEMWADIPKASQLRFNADGTATFYPNTDRSWTLEFLQP